MDEYKEYAQMSDADIDKQIDDMVDTNARPIMVCAKLLRSNISIHLNSNLQHLVSI